MKNNYSMGISQINHTLQDFLEQSCSQELKQAEKRLRSRVTETSVTNWIAYKIMREGGQT